jgi:hypothetical protein
MPVDVRYRGVCRGEEVIKEKYNCMVVWYRGEEVI